MVDMDETQPIRATLPLDSGSISIEWSGSFTRDDYEDVKEWFAILERRMGRQTRQQRGVSDG